MSPRTCDTCAILTEGSAGRKLSAKGSSGPPAPERKRNADMIDGCGGLKPISRRGFVQRAACAAAGATLTGLSSAVTSGQGPRAGREVLREFPYGAVQLTGGPIKEHFDRSFTRTIFAPRQRSPAQECFGERTRLRGAAGRHGRLGTSTKRLRARPDPGTIHTPDWPGSVRRRATGRRTPKWRGWCLLRLSGSSPECQGRGGRRPDAVRDHDVALPVVGHGDDRRAEIGRHGQPRQARDA